jgi:hypothetical protein
MELSEKEKEQLRKNRLKEYLVKIYSLEMDLVACEAAGDTQGAEIAKTNLEGLRKAYKAIEEMG